MAKTSTYRIKDYAEYKTIIEHVQTYVGEKPLKSGDVIGEKMVKNTTMLNGAPAKKLGEKTLVKDGSVIWEYVTQKDKLKNTVTRYALVTDIVLSGGLSALIKDVTDRIMSGAVTSEEGLAEIEKARLDLLKA